MRIQSLLIGIIKTNVVKSLTSDVIRLSNPKFHKKSIQQIENLLGKKWFSYIPPINNNLINKIIKNEIDAMQVIVNLSY